MKISCSILTLIFFANVVGVCFGQCLDDQKALLIDLKSSLVFNANQSVKLTKWDHRVDCCSWPGVACSSEGRVIELDLSYEGIYGGFNEYSSIFHLKYLQRLTLGHNRFDVEISTRFAELSALRYLSLSYAGFKGQVPIELSKLRELRVLVIETYLFIYLLAISDLAGLVENMTHLTELYLDSVDISSSSRTWMNGLSSSALNLEVLSISNCQLIMPADDYSLVRLQFLTHLRLDGNDLSSLDPRVFVKFSHLVTLSLANCGLQGPFPAELFQLPALQDLDLSNNQRLNRNFPRFLVNNSLETVVLAQTNFSGNIPDSVGELKKLSRLDLSYCNFHGEIPSQLWTLKNIVQINLSGNKLNGSVQSLSSLPKLTSLILSGNLLTGSISELNWKELVALEYLDLTNNSFNGIIPAVLFSMPSLQTLDLSHNMFQNLENVENNNASISLISYLYLSSNTLTMSSSQPLDLCMFGQLRNLLFLDLSFNDLSLGSPKGDCLFPQLRSLKLASCNLKAFPEFLKHQSNLFTLDLSNNQIQGVIPKWLWGLESLSQLYLSNNSLESFEDRKLKSLSALDLHSNLLQGELPIPPPDAIYLDFSTNNFSSKLAPEIGKYLSGVIYFSLASNSFEGTIPSSICDAQNAQFFDLSNNLFHGQLPPCIVDSSSNLAVLNIRNNSISGYIPDSFTVNCRLRTLDLSGNFIIGKLPKSLANCHQLEVLNLGNNQIDDLFPCWLRNVSSIRALGLRSNSLHGSIRCQDKTQAWTMLRILDLAGNKLNDSVSPDFWSSLKGLMSNNTEAESTRNYLKVNALYMAGEYYESITITSKGNQMELVKISTVFSSVDLSRNQFSGEIPYTIGNLTSLQVMNLSYNMFTSHIPASLGNLKKLESLDLSQNQLTGHIPPELATLTFLSDLNLSYNSLEGRVPNGGQFNTFTNESYMGNKALCGAPIRECPFMTPSQKSPPPSDKSSSFLRTIDWEVILPVFGFIIGAGLVLATIMFNEKWKLWHDHVAHKLITLIRPS